MQIFSLARRPPKTVIKNYGKSKTQQQFADDADINKIMERYTNMGALPQVGSGKPFYGIFDSGYDFQTANNALIEAKEQFMALPSKVRSKFENNPAMLIEFLRDEKNRDEAIDLGLVEKPEGWIPPAQRVSKHIRDRVNKVREQFVDQPEVLEKLKGLEALGASNQPSEGEGEGV